MTLNPDEMRTSAAGIYLTAKRFYAMALSLRAVSFLLGVLAAFKGLSWWIPVFLLALSVAADGLLMASDTRKGKAEDLMRRLEFWDGFGWPPSEREARQVPSIRTRPDALYFASEEASGPVRAMENLEEQAWWSRELYQRMASAMDGTLVVTVLSTIVVLMLVVASGP